MIISVKGLQFVLHATPTKDVRYYLNGVLVSKNALVATDGHRLAVSRHLKNLSNEQHEDFIIPIEAVKMALKMQPKAWDEIEVTSEKIGDLNYQAIDGRYPNWAQVIPEKVTHDDAVYNPVYLAESYKALAKINDLKKEYNEINLSKNGDASGIIQGPDKNHFVVLMPFSSRKVELKATPYTSWAKL